MRLMHRIMGQDIYSYCFLERLQCVSPGYALYSILDFNWGKRSLFYFQRVSFGKHQGFIIPGFHKR